MFVVQNMCFNTHIPSVMNCRLQYDHRNPDNVVRAPPSAAGIRLRRDGRGLSGTA